MTPDNEMPDAVYVETGKPNRGSVSPYKGAFDSETEYLRAEPVREAIRVMAEALEFYADENNHISKEQIVGDLRIYCSAFALDEGCRARVALNNPAFKAAVGE